MKTLLLALCLSLSLTLTADARPTSDTYPHFYVMDDSLPYLVQSEDGIPEWFDEDENTWFFSEAFPTEAHLLRCEYIRRID